MEPDTGAGDQPGRPVFLRWAVPVLWLTVIISGVFGALILVIPLDLYRLLGHVLEASVALFCMGCCLSLYRSVSGRLLLLLAAFAFFSYALTTTFWYLYTVALGRLSVFTTVAEFGFLCFFFFFIAAISIEFPDRGLSPAATIFLLIVFLAVPIAAGFAVGDQPLHLALVTIRFLVIGILVITAIRHGVSTYTLLWAGICLRCIASMLYGIREAFFIIYPFPVFSGLAGLVPLTVYDLLSIVGPMIVCSLALIQLGLIAYVTGSHDAFFRA